MKRRAILCFCCTATAAAASATGFGNPAAAADNDLSAADRSFMAMVSQGGMFEVEAGKLGSQKAARQDITDIGFTEVHDHELVGAKLRSIAEAAGVQLDTTLNPMFQHRLDRLNGLSGVAFDNAFIQEMDAIHAADGAAFAKEAKEGHNPALRAFAAETVLIVDRHLGALHALPLQKV